nr:hypothetical protein [Dyella sp. ASV24]
MLEYTKGADGSTLPYVIGTLSAEDFAEFMSSGAPVLSLNAGLGWAGDLGFLREKPDFAGRGLHLLPVEHAFDVTSLNEITSLRYLYLGLGCRGGFDVSLHDRLEELRMFASPSAIKLKLANSRLKALYCRGSDIKDPSVLSTMKGLVSLSINKATFEPDQLPKDMPIRFAEFYAWSKLKDLSGISAWPLRDLKLSSCRHIADYSSISKLDKLETLFLDDCSSLPSAEMLKGLRHLHEIDMRGTEFVDKDISSLASLPLDVLRLSGKGYFPDPETWADER